MEAETEAMRPSTREVTRPRHDSVFYPAIVHPDGRKEVILGFQYDRQVDAEDEARAEIDKRSGPRPK